MKRYAVIAWILAALMLFSACSILGNLKKEDDPVAGTWIGQYTKFVGDDDSARDTSDEFKLVLKANGTGTHYRDDTDFKVTWKLDGEAFTMQETFLGISVDYEGTLTGDDLSIFNGDPENPFTVEYVYVKEGGTSARKDPAPAKADEDDKKEPEATETPDEPEDGGEEPAQEPAGTQASGDEGRYVLYEYEAGGQKMTHEILVQAGMEDTYLWLKPGGEAELTMFGQSIDATWKPGTVTVYGSVNYSYTIEGDTLTLDMAGVTYIMKREDGGAAPEKEPAPEKTEEPAAEPEPTQEPEAPKASDAPGGDGLMSDEDVQKGYVWMSEVAKDIYNTTYEELAEHFGVEGKFDKEEYDSDRKLNKRFYFWISEEDDTVFIYVNFQEKEPGVYKVSSFNSSGFSVSGAKDKYLEQLREEAREADKAAAANMSMKDFSVEVYPWGHKDDTVTIKMQIPESGWAYDDSRDHLVENEDVDAWDAGFIQFELETSIDSFDFYKDKFEDYKEIGDRTIGGVTFKGRTYKYIGYEWTEYIAMIDGTHALSIGIVQVDVSEGSMGDKILNSISFN